MAEQKSLKSMLKAYWLLFVAPFVLLSRIILTGNVLFWGTPGLQFVPWWWQAWEQIRAGGIPLWNPLNGMGAPLLANYQAAFFYPPNALVLLPLAAVAGPAGIAWGFTLLACLHLAWAGLGMAFVLRRMGFGWLAQMVGGLAFGLSGYVVGRLGFFSMVWVFAWLPWVLYQVEVMLANKRWPPVSVGLAGCVTMQLLAGHAQLSWYSLLLAGVWLLVGMWRCAAWKRAGPLLAGAAVSILLGAVLAMVQLLPTAQYLAQSQRAEAVQYEDAMKYSFWPWRFISIVSPDFFGNPGQGNYWGYASFWEDHVYMGIVPLALALATLVLLMKGLFRAERRTEHWKLSLFLWVLVVVTFVLALGQNTPVFPFLYRVVPTFKLFQAPARYLVWLAVAVPVLAAIGVEHWRSPSGRGLYWFRLATAGAFAVTLGALVGWASQQSIRLTFIRATALTGIWALGFGLLTLTIPLAEKRGWQPLWRWAVLAWTLIDLVAAGWFLNPGVPLTFYRQDPQPRSEVAAVAGSGRVYLADRLEYELKFNRFLRFKDFQPIEDWSVMRAALIPNLNLLDEIPMVNNFDPLVPGRFAFWMEAMKDRSPSENEPWLDLMAVGAEEKIDVRQPNGVRFDPVKMSGRLRWYSCIQVASGEVDAWTRLEQALATGQAESAPLIVEGWQEEPARDCVSQSGAQLRWIREEPDHSTIEVESDTPGWLLLADTWYPGWGAWLDSKALPLVRANYLYKAVPVPAGKHMIDVIYSPVEFYLGCLFSILGIFVCILFMKWSRAGQPIREMPGRK